MAARGHTRAPRLPCGVVDGGLLIPSIALLLSTNVVRHRMAAQHIFPQRSVAKANFHARFVPDDAVVDED